MPDNLKGLIDKSIESNGKVLNRSKRKYTNQEFKEFNWRKKLKKGFIYGSLFSALALGVYGGSVGLAEYKDYVAQQGEKVVYYQKKFNRVKGIYNNRLYMKADELSEKIQKELDKEWFFSPTNDLYKKVKEYDDKFIDPEVKKIKRERFYQKLKEVPRKMFYDLEDKWDGATPGQKAVVYLCGLGLLIYLFRRR